jgi:hypothetical protein
METKVAEMTEATKGLLEYCITNEPSCAKLALTVQQALIKPVYNIILELAQDSFRLIEEKRHVSSTTLLRSLFEYNVELLYLSKDPDNLKQRNLDAMCEQLKIINRISETKDESLSKFKTDPRFQPRKKELNAATKGHKKKNLWDLCNEIGCTDMYDTVYRIVSPDAHPNMPRYSNRYYSVSEACIDYNSSPQLSDESTIQGLTLLSQILIVSTRKTHEILPDGDVSAIEPKLTEFKEVVIDLLGDFAATPNPGQ